MGLSSNWSLSSGLVEADPYRNTKCHRLLTLNRWVTSQFYSWWLMRLYPKVKVKACVPEFRKVNFSVPEIDVAEL